MRGPKSTAPKRKLIRRKRWARKAKPTGLVNRALHPIPQRYITKMKYSEFISTNANGNYAFNLNSIYDPNRTGVGHQPYGFDQLAALYNRYRVIACGFRLHIAAGTGTSGQQSIQLAALPSNEPQTVLSISEWRENPRCKYICQNAGAATQYLTGKVYIPSLVGRTRAQYMADDRYQALTTGDPQEAAVLNICTAGGADATVGGSGVQVVLEYTVEFFDIKTVGQS